MADTLKEGKAVISSRDKAYYRRRQQNRIHTGIAALFAEEAEAGRMNKRKLADLLGKDPAQVTRQLTDPSNLEIDTISDYLLAMGAEMDHRVVRFSDRPKSNYMHPIIAKLVMQPQKARQENTKTFQVKPLTGNTNATSVQLSFQ
jgi:hypothetical protein